ncbi:MAG: hypothetical protein WKG00_12215 [Polyangiaceae bacterium]
MPAPPYSRLLCGAAMLGALALASPATAAGRPRISPVERPGVAQTPIEVCSFDLPLCVHAPTAVPPPAMLAALAELEHAWRAYAALGLPAPLDDGLLGGGHAFDAYLMRAGEPRAGWDMAPAAGTHDQTSAFAVLPPPGRGQRRGCAGASDAARVLAQAIALRLDAGVDDGSLAMASSYLASLVSPCGVLETVAVDDFQRAPEREIVAASPQAMDGSLLFPMFLDDRYGNGGPAAVVTGLLGVSGQRTAPGAPEWATEPDLFDALLLAERDRRLEAGDVLLEFAIARAFAGSRSDGAHLSDADRFGAMGRVRVEWSVPWATLPRRLAPVRPIQPTGATYVWLDLAGAPSGAELTFVADWELPVPFYWALVKVDGEGREAGRVEVARIFGASHAERTVVGLEGLAGVLVVGVNGGHIDRANTYDPDDAPHEPHGYTVTLVK